MRPTAQHHSAQGWLGLGMVVMGGLVMACLLLMTGCIPATTHPRISREFVVTEPPDIAYRRAVSTTLAVGGTIVQQDPRLHILQAYVGGTMSLDVRVQPQGTGSHINVSHQTLPTYFTPGTDGHLTDDFMTTYRQQP